MQMLCDHHLNENYLVSSTFQFSAHGSSITFESAVGKLPKRHPFQCFSNTFLALYQSRSYYCKNHFKLV